MAFKFGVKYPTVIGIGNFMFYVYVHKKKTDGTVFYVGKGKGRRAWFKKGRTQFWHRTVKKYGLTVEIVQDGLQEWYAFELEQNLIAYYGRMDLGNGSLVNVSDGGEGPSGHVFTEEQKENLRVAKQKTWNSQEYREKISQMMKKRWKENPELCAKAVPAMHNPQARRKARESINKYWEKESSRNMQSVISQGMWSDKDHKEKRIKKMIEAQNRPEMIELKRRQMMDRRGEFIKPVRCVEENKTFESVTEAVKWLKSIGFSKACTTNISRCIKDSSAKAYKMHWVRDSVDV